MTIGLREIEATEETIRELRAAGQGERADALAAVLAHAVDALVLPRARLPRPFLTTAQAARALGVSIQTIRIWAEAGGFRTALLGGRHVVDRQELLAYVESLRGVPRGLGPFDGPGVDQERVRMGLEGGAEGSWHEQMVRALPADKVARAEALHTRTEAGERLSRAERAEMVVLERELADAAARELRRRLRALRSHSR